MRFGEEWVEMGVLAGWVVWLCWAGGERAIRRAPVNHRVVGSEHGVYSSRRSRPQIPTTRRYYRLWQLLQGVIPRATYDVCG